MAMNRNPLMQPSRYQSYGTISKAIACTDQCETHASSITAKTVWLPRSHTTEQMAVTAEQIRRKKERDSAWVQEVRTIARHLLVQQQIQKQQWRLRLSYDTEEDMREEIKYDKTRYKECNKDIPKPAKLIKPPPTVRNKNNKYSPRKGKPTPSKPERQSSRLHKPPAT